MKIKLLYWVGLMILVFLCLTVTAFAVDSPVGVVYRGHIQDLGDYPSDGSWLDSPEMIGTKGQSKRIEGFSIKLTGDIPADMVIRYNVHVQNKGWLYDANDSTDWPQDGDYAGTSGQSLRIEAVKIVLTDTSGEAVSGYGVKYRGHVQNLGDLPADDSQWLADGAQLGTVGSSLRLEALLVAVVKNKTDLTAYTALLAQIEKTAPEDYTVASWTALQTAIESHAVTAEQSQMTVNAAVKAIQTAYHQLVKKAEPVVYDSAGTFGPASGNETIDGDVTLVADAVILQNLVIEGQLTISEAVGDGTVTLNNVTVMGDTFVRGGGVNSIHINGGSYKTIVMEKTASGAVRIVATDATGLAVVIAEDAAGETIILQGAFDSVAVNAPELSVTTAGPATTIGRLSVGATAAGSILNLAAGTTVQALMINGKSAIKGPGNVIGAIVNVDGVVFEKAPQRLMVAPGLTVPPVVTPVPPPSDPGPGSPAKKQLSISAPTITTAKYYDGTTRAAVTAGTLTGVAPGDQVTVTAMANYDSKTAGGDKHIQVTYTLAGADAGNYIKPGNTAASGIIAPKPLSFNIFTHRISKVYDGTNKAAVEIGHLMGIVGTDEVSILSTAASYYDETADTHKFITVSCILTGSDKDNYQAPIYTLFGEITPQPLTAAGVVVSTDKSYDGSTNANVTDNGTVTGVVGADDVIVTPIANYATKKAEANKPLTVTYVLTGDETVLGNYTAPVDEIYPTAGAITPIDLVMSGITVTTAKAYDGTATAAVTNPGTIDNKYRQDDVVPVTTAAYSTPAVGDKLAVWVTVSLTGADRENYRPLTRLVTDQGEITSKQLTVTSQNLTTTKVYDGLATAAVTEVTLSGVTEGENVAVTATASYNDPQLGSEKPITVVYQITGEDIGNYLKPDDFTTTIGVIKKDLRVVSYDSSTGSWSAPTVANELAIATELPQGFRIFAVDHDGAVFAGAGYGTIKQYGGGNTWETPFSGELLLANPVYAGVADGIALAVDPTDGKVYQITQDADTWSDSLSTINLAGREVVGAYQTAAGADCYLVLKQEGTLIQYNLTTKTELNPLIEFPTIPDGYQICGVNVAGGQLNIYLWPLS